MEQQVLKHRVCVNALPNRVQSKLCLDEEGEPQLYSFSFEGETYYFVKAAKAAHPALPHFANMPHGENLYVSENIPHSHLKYTLGTTILSHRLLRDDPWRRTMAEFLRMEDVITQVLNGPNESFSHLGLLSVFRKQFFEALCVVNYLDVQKPATVREHDLLGVTRLVSYVQDKVTNDSYVTKNELNECLQSIMSGT